MFADDFVGISRTPKGLQKQIRENTRMHYEMESDSEREIFAVVVCHEDEVNPVNFKWKWGEDELPIVDQYAYLGVDISKVCAWVAYSESNMKG